MKKWGTIIIVIVLVSFFAGYLISPAAFADGLAVGPSALEIKDALRGGDYERLIILFNPGDEETTYTLGAIGDAGAWISFWDINALDTSVERVNMPAHDEKSLLVKITIPPDAENGQHEAIIIVASVPSKSNQGGGQAVSISAQVHVTVMVTGDQLLMGTVNNISTTDTEVNQPLQIKISFKNTGNVVAKPQIAVEISSNGDIIDSISFEDAQIKPEKVEVIPVEWDTTGRQAGNYSAHVVVSLDGTTITEKDLEFALLPLGTLSRSGMLTEISLQGEPKEASLVVILATFVNTGQINTRAKFVGEVYCNSDLIDVVESDEILIAVGESDVLRSYLRLENSGKYQIEGYINFEGKKTEVKKLSFSVGNTGDEAESESSPMGWIGGIAAGIAGLIIGILTLRRMRT